MKQTLRDLLEAKYHAFHRMDFIDSDPIQIPHQFSRLQDREIMGFWVAILAWGQRKTILDKAQTLIQRMDGAPYDFILNHQESDRKRFLGFKHRTFNDTDCLYFLEFFQQHYKQHHSLESAFLRGHTEDSDHVGPALNGFYDYFFSLESFPSRTKKHVACPKKKAACKRINMFLRWMVRKDQVGVDFGLWEGIKPNQLICPLDVHVGRIALQLGLIKAEKFDWATALALTEELKTLDPMDPVKYDFALYGMGLEQKYQGHGLYQ